MYFTVEVCSILALLAKLYPPRGHIFQEGLLGKHNKDILSETSSPKTLLLGM